MNLACKHLRQAGRLSQVDAVLVVNGIGEGRKQENVGDWRLTEDGLEH